MATTLPCRGLSGTTHQINTTEQANRQRTAIVTGAARGIGAGVAKRLARDGLAVGVIDLSEEDCAGTVEAITRDGGTAAAFAADVDDETAVATAVARIAAELGSPTVLINNAGIGGPNAGVEETSTQQWDAVTGVSLRGAFFLTRAVSPYMTAAGWGRIVKCRASPRSAIPAASTTPPRRPDSSASPSRSPSSSDGMA